MSASRVELSNRIRAQQAAQAARNDRSELLGLPEDQENGYSNPFMPASQDELSRMDNRQIMQHATDMHRDTTATAQRGLKIVQDTQEVANATQAALYHQGKQIDAVNGNLAMMREDISYAQKILRYMRRCCCCACCGDPEYQREREWANKVGRNEDLAAEDAAAVAAFRESERNRQHQTGAYTQQQQLKQKYKGATYGGPDTGRIRDTHGEEADAIDEETRKQDEYFSEIEKGLDNLKSTALNMQREVDRQDEKIYGAQRGTDTVGMSLYEMNHRSQLRHFAK